eukprot:s1775_g1.t1
MNLWANGNGCIEQFSDILMLRCSSFVPFEHIFALEGLVARPSIRTIEEAHILLRCQDSNLLLVGHCLMTCSNDGIRDIQISSSIRRAASDVSLENESGLQCHWRRFQEEGRLISSLLGCTTPPQLPCGPQAAMVMKTEMPKPPSKVTARNLEHAVEALKTGRVRRMDLRYRKIGDRGAECLSEILLENSSLQKLELDYNGISSGGAARIAEALTMNSTLTHLYLCNNFIDDEGAIHLASALETGCALNQLYLAGNCITNRGGQAPSICGRNI